MSVLKAEIYDTGYSGAVPHERRWKEPDNIYCCHCSNLRRPPSHSCQNFTMVHRTRRGNMKSRASPDIIEYGYRLVGPSFTSCFHSTSLQGLHLYHVRVSCQKQRGHLLEGSLAGIPN